jgi:ADP-ribosyl-[dinitrogen reductase] hydrolase
LSPNFNNHTRLAGILIGGAIGDSLGLPGEGLRPDQIRRRWKGIWKQRFLFGYGMWSDDTEHAFLVGQALLQEPLDPNRFQRCLGWKLRWWLAGLPAGVGLATARAIIKLWMGFPPDRSGVYSAGNGPAMRTAIIGAFFADDSAKLRKFVAAATRITHTDPRAETAALAVAEAAAWIVRGNENIETFLHRLADCGDNPEWKKICHHLSTAYFANKSISEFCSSLGLDRGVTGYAFHSVPVALYAWLRHPKNFKLALSETLDCGGDTDSTGAIVGALAGAGAGVESIPKEWMANILEWPRTLSLMHRLATRLEQPTEKSSGPVTYFWPGLIFRNIIFLIIVLIHGLRRLLPPY